MPPRLPPRSPSQASTTSNLTEQFSPNPPPRENTIHLTPQAIPNHPYSNHVGLDDPRTSSTQSLRPTESRGPNRRTLLIVYIHGFMGNETSFRSFPAHVHSLLSITLAESHVVHTKIYPRYKSRKNISFARDAFSNWLAPHESNTTDIVLIGHSLGGILGAEVVLIPSHKPGSHDIYQHRILGLVAFDTPFLGMHPGVVSTGIASLFRGAPDTTPEPSDVSRPVETVPGDPNYNPAFPNDVKLPVRANKWEKAWYFFNKHSGELRQAAQSYVKSHLEFGGCLADYPGLRRRYDAIRDLEDINDLEKRTTPDGKALRRVRFVNYYTASTGRIKEQKSPLQDQALTHETEMQALTPPSIDGVSDRSVTPRLSLEEHRENRVIDKTEELDIDGVESGEDEMQSIEPQPHEAIGELDPITSTTDSSGYDDLPPIPPEPVLPSALNEAQFPDPDVLRLAQKNHARQIKAYERAHKDYQEGIRDREKLITKRQRQAQKEQERIDDISKRDEERLAQDNSRRQTTLNPEDQDRQMREEVKDRPSNADKKKRDRKFCSLPAKDSKGLSDPTWIRVYMEGMDEVVAHTSLFFVSDTYAKLVGDTAERIEQWLSEDATTRVLQLEQGT